MLGLASSNNLVNTKNANKELIILLDLVQLILPASAIPHTKEVFFELQYNNPFLFEQINQTKNKIKAYEKNKSNDTARAAHWIYLSTVQLNVRTSQKRLIIISHYNNVHFLI